MENRPAPSRGRRLLFQWTLTKHFLLSAGEGGETQALAPKNQIQEDMGTVINSELEMEAGVPPVPLGHMSAQGLV